MPARPVWKGSLKLSLINVGIRVYNATTPAGDISFRQVHKTCGTPIQLKKWCPHHEREVPNDELAKGYEIEKGEFVLLDPSDIKAVRPPATFTVEISRVVDQSEVDPIYVEKPYYVLPENKNAGSALAVIRQALSKRAAIGTVALHGREYVVALMPRGEGMLMVTLRRADEVVAMSKLDADEFADGRVNPAELKLANRVLEGFEGHLDLTKYPDEYEAALRKMIEDKAAGRKIVTPGAPKAAKVVNLMDALRKSLEQVQRGQRGRAAGRPSRTAAVSARRAHRRGKVLAHRSRRASA
jgi:DNA end-binding protein Ku